MHRDVYASRNVVDDVLGGAAPENGRGGSSSHRGAVGGGTERPDVVVASDTRAGAVTAMVAAGVRASGGIRSRSGDRLVVCHHAVRIAIRVVVWSTTTPGTHESVPGVWR